MKARGPVARYESPPKREPRAPKVPTLAEVAVGGSETAQAVAAKLIEINESLAGLGATHGDVWRALLKANAEDIRYLTQQIERAIKAKSLQLALEGDLAAIKYVLTNIKHYDEQWTAPAPADVRLALLQQRNNITIRIVEDGNDQS